MFKLVLTVASLLLLNQNAFSQNRLPLQFEVSDLRGVRVQNQVVSNYVLAEDENGNVKRDSLLAQILEYIGKTDIETIRRSLDQKKKLSFSNTFAYVDNELKIDDDKDIDMEVRLARNVFRQFLFTFLKAKNSMSDRIQTILPLFPELRLRIQNFQSGMEAVFDSMNANIQIDEKSLLVYKKLIAVEYFAELAVRLGISENIPQYAVPEKTKQMEYETSHLITKQLAALFSDRFDDFSVELGLELERFEQFVQNLGANNRSRNRIERTNERALLIQSKITMRDALSLDDSDSTYFRWLAQREEPLMRSSGFSIKNVLPAFNHTLHLPNGSHRGFAITAAGTIGLVLSALVYGAALNTFDLTVLQKIVGAIPAFGFASLLSIYSHIKYTDNSIHYTIVGPRKLRCASNFQF